MDTEKVVVILLVISILFSAFAVAINIAVKSQTSEPLIIGGGVDRYTTIRTTIGEPAGGQIRLNIEGGP